IPAISRSSSQAELMTLRHCAIGVRLHRSRCGVSRRKKGRTQITYRTCLRSPTTLGKPSDNRNGMTHAPSPIMKPSPWLAEVFCASLISVSLIACAGGEESGDARTEDALTSSSEQREIARALPGAGVYTRNVAGPRSFRLIVVPSFSNANVDLDLRVLE